MEAVSVLDDPNKSPEENRGGGSSSSLWESLGFGRIWDSQSTVVSDDDTINIFSLASGHLYERFLRIMMLSVLENTKSKVKFWLLGNFLSPRMKNFMPYFAKKKGFEYEFVQYQWPAWLHKQTD